MPVEVVRAFVFVCTEPDCGGKSPTVRPTRAEAESDELAHMGVMHEKREYCVRCGAHGIQPCSTPTGRDHAVRWKTNWRRKR